MNLKLTLLLALLSATTATANFLTEADIIAKEMAWAKKSVFHFQHGFKAEHPLHWAVHDEALFEMPKHEPFLASDDSGDSRIEEQQYSLKLRGGKRP